MIAILLAFILFAQGIPVLPNQSGTVTGTLKTADGKPAIGVRVAAVARPDSLQEAAAGAAMASLGETDVAGRYRLENVPPGRYYIAAGRVDQQTYYPGTLEMAGATTVLVTPGAVIAGLDFAMKEASVGRADLGFGINLVPTSIMVPFKVTAEGGSGKLPVFAPGGFTLLRLTRVTDGMERTAGLSTPSTNVPIPAGSTIDEYRVAITNLPEVYVVKSMTSGSTDLMTNTLKIPATSTLPTATGTVVLNTTSANLTSSILQLLGVVGGVATPLPTVPTVAITLAPNAPVSVKTPGVRITGRATGTESRSIYISGTPGIFYSDGTFEFRGVPPGRHAIATLDNPSSSQPLAASIVVGDRDIENLVLEATRLLPLGMRTAAAPGPAGAHPPGSVLPLASLRGRVVEETGRGSVTDGTVFVSGHYGTSVSTDAEGRFEIPRLLPGDYKLEIQVFGHSTLRQTVTIGEEDVNLDLSTRRLY